MCFEPKWRRSEKTFRRKMRLIASGLASTHWASLGVQHDQITEEVVVGAHVHRPVHGRGEEDEGRGIFTYHLSLLTRE